MTGMDELYVYPRLEPETSSLVLAELAPLSLPELRERSTTSHPAASYYPTGTPVPQERLAHVRDSVRDALANLGFPEAHGHRLRLINTFDQRLAGRSTGLCGSSPPTPLPRGSGRSSH